MRSIKDCQMSKDEALTLVLDALENHIEDPRCDNLIEKLITAVKAALKAKDEPAPVAKNEAGRITWLIDDWPQNCLLYTHPPQSFTYEQVKAHIRAASMSANDISVGSDTTEDGVSIVIRRRDELLYAEFFAYTPPQRTWVGLTNEEKKDLCRSWSSPMDAIYATEDKLKDKNVSET
jgi:hypothetical protein